MQERAVIKKKKVWLITFINFYLLSCPLQVGPGPQVLTDPAESLFNEDRTAKL